MAKYTIADFLKVDLQPSQLYGNNQPYYYQISGGVLKYGHEGIDFPTINGTELYSPFDGIIVRDQFDAKAYGNFLVVWDPIQLCALWFCHLLDTCVKEGDKVAKGQLIGRTNNTGNTTGPHCHVNFVETDANGIRLNKDNGEQGFLNLLDETLVQIQPFALAPSQPVSQPTPQQTNAVQEPLTPPVVENQPIPTIQNTQPAVSGDDLTSMRRQMNTAIEQSAEVSQKYNTDLANYTGLVAGGYNTVDDVNKALKIITDENLGLQKQILQTKDRNIVLANQIATLEKEDATAIQIGLKAQYDKKDLWSTITSIAQAHGTKPTLEAILAKVDKLRSATDTAIGKLRNQETKQSIAQSKIPKTPAQPQDKTLSWFERVILGKKVNV